MNNINTAKTSRGSKPDMTIRHAEEGIVPLFPRKETSSLNTNLSHQLQELLELLSPEKTGGPAYRNRFLIRKGHQFISVPVTDIWYFYSREKLCFVKTIDNKDYVVPFSIAEIEGMVSPKRFFRVSRKYIISHGAITKILVWFNGKLKVEIQPGATEDIVISRERVNGFKTWLGE
ncbi:LytTR family transcriptional regulator [Paraflavitalea soli]|uniref:LytTR family transcriptional regulator n=1 Tax=Paraflavitalea soli TaxID=2315862 RepID=A0A3B7MVB3_9BACT|nr:LytTR family DNA-binding domain-containing protein [Paraflavitalea soli]AXY77857.1 LytTR family transcriptional regulator [Paraflavitalea soli]